MSEIIRPGDLTVLARDIESAFEEHDLSDPAFGVAFTLPRDRQHCHWVTNVKRALSPREWGS